MYPMLMCPTIITTFLKKIDKMLLDNKAVKPVYLFLKYHWADTLIFIGVNAMITDVINHIVYGL